MGPGIQQPSVEQASSGNAWLDVVKVLFRSGRAYIGRRLDFLEPTRNRRRNGPRHSAAQRGAGQQRERVARCREGFVQIGKGVYWPPFGFPRTHSQPEAEWAQAFSSPAWSRPAAGTRGSMS